MPRPAPGCAAKLEIAGDVPPDFGFSPNQNEAISKVIQKMAKMASQRTARGAKRGRFDNFEEF
ncbi:MAG: hypothetical protein IKA65_03095 [Lentisphaeria bacterium]|nr:hypothetical protein [Lentisphaeria bacterium]